MRALREALNHEEDLSESRRAEQIKVLELTLADLEFRYLSGECDAGERKSMETVLASAIDSVRNAESSGIGPLSRSSAPSTLETILMKRASHLEDSVEYSSVEEKAVRSGASDFLDETKNTMRRKRNLRQSELTSKRRATRSRRRRKRESHLDAYCKNPWNGDCKNADIELSIYYNGAFLPICHKCWQDISNKNLEWSGF